MLKGTHNCANPVPDSVPTASLTRPVAVPSTTDVDGCTNGRADGGVDDCSDCGADEGSTKSAITLQH